MVLVGVQGVFYSLVVYGFFLNLASEYDMVYVLFLL